VEELGSDNLPVWFVAGWVVQDKHRENTSNILAIVQILLGMMSVFTANQANQM